MNVYYVMMDLLMKMENVLNIVIKHVKIVLLNQ